MSDSPYKTACIRRRARESIFRGRGIVLTDGSGNRKVVQRNIIALLDNAGNVVVNYIYDAWGNYVKDFTKLAIKSDLIVSAFNTVANICIFLVC